MTGALVLLGVLGFQASQDHDTNALRAASAAYYRQSGIEQQVDELSARLARQYTTPELRLVVGNLALVTRTVMEQRISFEWRFP